METTQGLLFIFLLLGPLLIVQRSLHRQIQAVFLLLTRRADVALALFSLLFLPGVLLHELSHYLTALLLGVRTGRFSVVPKSMGNGRLRLGYVETERTDPLREALIGAAPLLAGGAFVAYAGLAQMGLGEVWSGVSGGLLQNPIEVVQALVGRPDFWLWFYLTFTISSTMLPSASDRRAWLPIGLAVGVLILLALLAGAGPWMAEHLADPFDRAMRSAAVVLAISIFVHALWLPLAWMSHVVLTRLTGLEVA